MDLPQSQSHTASATTDLRLPSRSSVTQHCRRVLVANFNSKIYTSSFTNCEYYHSVLSHTQLTTNQHTCEQIKAIYALQNNSNEIKSLHIPGKPCHQLKIASFPNLLRNKTGPQRKSLQHHGAKHIASSPQ